MYIAVIIAARPENFAVLRWVLEGFAQQQLAGHSLEIRVGIDGPTDQRLPEIAGTFPVSVTPCPRSGAAAVRNQLVAQTSADLLIFGNADACPDPDMVQQHADTIATLPADSLVLGSAPWETPALPTVFDALLAETPMIFFYANMQAGQWYDFRHAWTLNLSVRRKTFLAAGGFPETLRPVYYEDIALGNRILGLHKKGILYHPAARVIHRHPTTLDQYLDREELLGLMAPVLAKVSPELFASLHGSADVWALAGQFRTWLELDKSMHRYIYKRLNEWAPLPQSTIGPTATESRTRLLNTLYQMQIPLKRLAFRLGFLKGLELAEDSLWQSRTATSLWRPFIS